MERENTAFLGPYIVVGVGRCGTSSVARVMHENLKVYMGADFLPPDIKANPEGNYEDMHIVNLHRATIGGEISYASFLQKSSMLFESRGKMGRAWGFKDPMAVYFLPFYMCTFFRMPRVVWCTREKEKVIRSIKAHWSKTETQAVHIYQSRTDLLASTLKHFDHLRIDFTEKITDDELLQMLVEKWRELGC